MYFIVYDGKSNFAAVTDTTTVSSVQWKNNPKQYFKTYHAQPFECTCGKTITVGAKSRHLRSLKHRLFVLEHQSTDGTVQPTHAYPPKEKY